MSADEAARWDAQSESYDSSYDDPRRGRLVRARLSTALELLGEGPGRILDAGMGGGRLVEELAARGWTVTGSDVSDAMVALARRRAPQLAGKLVVAPVEALPFEAASFDAVAALGVLEFTASPEAAVHELSRVLVPGGRAIVSWPSFRGLYTAWRGGVLYRVARAVGRPAPPPARNPLEPERFEELLRAAELEPDVTSMLGPRGGAARSARRAAQLVFSARKR